jgi:hypothetical protein
MAHAAKTSTPKERTASKSQSELDADRRRAAAERTRGMLARLAPGRSLSDEMIADRRAEARAEDREDEEARQRRARR